MENWGEKRTERVSQLLSGSNRQIFGVSGVRGSVCYIKKSQKNNKEGVHEAGRAIPTLSESKFNLHIPNST